LPPDISRYGKTLFLKHVPLRSIYQLLVIITQIGILDFFVGYDQQPSAQREIIPPVQTTRLFILCVRDLNDYPDGMAGGDGMQHRVSPT
jgi:hypothetical protein